jgi:hypothetical protein
LHLNGNKNINVITVTYTDLEAASISKSKCSIAFLLIHVKSTDIFVPIWPHIFATAMPVIFEKTSHIFLHIAESNENTEVIQRKLQYKNLVSP